jgi:ADP-ribose pyrophosphatase
MRAKKSTKTIQTGKETSKEAGSNAAPEEQAAAATPSAAAETGKTTVRRAKKAAGKSVAKSGRSATAAGAAEKAATGPKGKVEAKTETKTEARTKRKTEGKTETMLDSQLAYEGPLFRVLRDHFIEPDGRESHRDVIRHNGSVVILAVDPSKKKKDPWVVLERQYRHAAGQYLWELPAGKLERGESGLDGAKRELAEETGYQARKWSTLMVYYASPGFLGESMTIFLAEGLIAGEAHPEEDEQIEFRLVKLSDLLEMVDKGKIIDGKTLTSTLLYARQLGLKRKH